MYLSLLPPVSAVLCCLVSLTEAVPTAQSLTINPGSILNSTTISTANLTQFGRDDSFSIPPTFSINLIQTTARKLPEWPFWSAFVSAMSTYTSLPFNDRILQARRFFDAESKVRLSIAPVNGLTLQTKHAMWGLYLCSQQIGKGSQGAAAFKPGGCELLFNGAKVGFLRLSSAKGGPGDAPDPGDLGGLGMAASNGTTAGTPAISSPALAPSTTGVVLSARDESPRNTTNIEDANALPKADIVTTITSASPNPSVSRTSTILTIFESLISLAQKPFPRSENPLINFALSSAGEGMRVEIQGQDVWISIPSFYAVMTQGMIQVVGGLEKKKVWGDTTFTISYKGTKVYNGKIGAAPVASA